jgi:hypothetical protein
MIYFAVNFVNFIHAFRSQDYFMINPSVVFISKLIMPSFLVLSHMKSYVISAFIIQGEIFMRCCLKANSFLRDCTYYALNLYSARRVPSSGMYDAIWFGRSLLVIQKNICHHNQDQKVSQAISKQCRAKCHSNTWLNQVSMIS